MKTLAFCLIMLVSPAIYSQDPPQKKTESIGFVIGITAGKSKVFEQIEELFKNKDYKTIIKLLKSDKPTEIFVSSLVCKELVQKNQITLTDRQQKTLDDNLSSQLPLIVRSGCTCHYEVTIQQLFNGVDDCNFDYSLNEWLPELFTLTED